MNVPEPCANANQDYEGNVGGCAADVLQPFADIEADDIEKHSDAEQKQGADDQKFSILGQPGVVFAANVSGHRSAGEQQAGKVIDGVNPICPSGDEAVKIAEGLLRPNVKSAFLRETRGKFGDDERRGDEKQNRGKNPEADGRRAVVPSGGDPARTQNGDDIEQKNVPETEDFSELMLGVLRRDRTHRSPLKL